MSITPVGLSVEPVQYTKNSTLNFKGEKKSESKKDGNSKFLYGSLAALAILGAGTVTYKAIKGKVIKKEEVEKITDVVVEVVEEPIKQDAKEKADAIAEVLKTTLNIVTKKEEAAKKVVEQKVVPVIEEPVKEKIGTIMEALKVAAERTAKENAFRDIKNGVAYNMKGELFNGERELVGWKNRRMVTRYENGKVVERTYFPTKRNDIMEVNRLYNNSVDGIKMVDTTRVYRDLRHDVNFEIIEKESTFPEHIERIIPKSQFDRPFDEGFYSKFPSEDKGLAKAWYLPDSIVVYGTGLSERGPRKMSLHHKGVWVRDFIDTPLGNIKGFRNKDAQMSIHTNLGYQELKVRSLTEPIITSYKGRTMDEAAEYVTKRYMQEQICK